MNEELWNTPLENKYASVEILPLESDYILTKDQRFELLMRLDRTFCGYRIKGSDQNFDEHLFNLCEMPEKDYKQVVVRGTELTNRESFKEVSDALNCKKQKAKEKAFQSYEDAVKEAYSKYSENVKNWQKDWKVSPFICNPSTIFEVDLISTQGTKPTSFFNWKTGKIGQVKSVGKWIETLGAFKEELDWIVKELPWLTCSVSVFDRENCEGNLICKFFLKGDGTYAALKFSFLREPCHTINMTPLEGSEMTSESPSLFERFLKRFFKRIWDEKYFYREYHYFKLKTVESFIKKWKVLKK